MDDLEFDKAIIAAAFAIAARDGWRAVSVFGAAKEAGLSPDLARVRFPLRAAILLRLGSLVDQAVLSVPADDAQPRERLFDLLIRRFDALSPYREGIAALLRGLPFDPTSALLLAAATRTSMGWMLEAAGIPVAGFSGHLRRDGLIGVWAMAMRAFVADSSPDLAATMAALDKALERAEKFALMLERAPTSVTVASPPPSPPSVTPN